MNRGMFVKISLATLTLGSALVLGRLGFAADEKAAGKTETVKGEIVDLMCYLDHGAKGEKHAGCAEKCIKSGGPVGLLTADRGVFLVVGDHKPMNDQLADKAGKMVTLKGKVVSRHDMKMIENAEIVE